MQIDFPSPHHIPQLRQLWRQVFGDPDLFLDSFFSTAYSPDRCRCIFLEGQIAAGLYWIDCMLETQKLAYLYAVSTHPDHRGKGLCRTLMENTRRLLLSQGYSGIILVPQDDGLRTMYAKMGYQNAGGITEFSCTAAENPIPLRAVGPEEFAALRRTLLPEKSVIQEGPGLAFLAQQLQFYAGEDFLLAGYRENSVFHGLELLGNPLAAAGILGTQNCHGGVFRCPGSKQPFAMFLPLAPGAISPDYFGFAFD